MLFGLCNSFPGRFPYFYLRLELSLIVASLFPIHALSHELRVPVYKNFVKRGITLEPFSWATHKLCHSHLHVLGLLCSKFHLDDSKIEGGIRDTTFHQQTNRPSDCQTDRLLTPVYQRDI